MKTSGVTTGRAASFYRAAAEIPRPPEAPPSRRMDGDVLVAMLVLWLASVLRVAGALARHEVFGTEASLAFMSAVIVPWLLARWAFQWLMDRRQGTISASAPQPLLRLVKGGDHR